VDGLHGWGPVRGGRRGRVGTACDGAGQPCIHEFGPLVTLTNHLGRFFTGVNVWGVTVKAYTCSARICVGWLLRIRGREPVLGFNAGLIRRCVRYTSLAVTVRAVWWGSTTSASAWRGLAGKVFLHRCGVAILGLRQP
jgi:hypothetical protein